MSGYQRVDVLLLRTSGFRLPWNAMMTRGDGYIAGGMSTLLVSSIEV